MSRLLQLCWPGDPPLLPNLDSVPLEELATAAGDQAVTWFIAVDNVRSALERVAKIRQQGNPARYLQPVVLVSEQGDTPPLLSAVGDRLSTRGRLADEMEHIARDVEPIHLWLAQLPEQTGTDDQLSVRVLRHLASRDMPATPVPSADFHSGYIYPPLMPYFGGSDAGIFETLAFLEQQQFLASDFVARAHTCYHCDSAYLNFEEVCVQCESADLEMVELVHHFRCGHVAPLSEYRSGGELHCGKCGRELRHIGVDYDKPSVMYRCNQCDHRMQDAEVRTTCYRCHRQTTPDNQRNRRICRYTLNPLGENGARFGVASLFTNILERDVGLVPWSVFERMVELEQSRIARFDRHESCALLISFAGIERVYTQLGNRAPQVFESLAEIFAQVLRTTDVVSTRNDSLYVVLLTETTREAARIPEGRLLERLNDVLAANIQEPPVVEAQLARIDGDFDLGAQVSALLSTAE